MYWCHVHFEIVLCCLLLHKKATILQVTIMLATSKNVTGTDNPSLLLSPLLAEVKGHQYQWLVDGYDLETGHF